VPALLITEELELPRRIKEIDHLRSLANQVCISTIPEDSRGGKLCKA
jgi:hypothetical protein